MECVIEKERVEQAMTDLVEHNIPYDIEFTIFPRNSTETRTIHSIAVLEKDEDGNPSKVIGTLHDITEHRKSERSAENEKAFLNTVLDNIKEAIIICDQDGHIIRFNESARKLHHLPEKPIPPEQWPEYYDLYYSDGSTLLAPEDIPLFRALKGDDVVDIEIVVTPKSTGISHLLSCNGHQLINSDEEIVGAVVAMHDITEQRKAEKKISAASEEKDYLMKELNHRVKNNLLMVSSLIHLKDMETEIDLSDIQHQINSISLIHEQLSQSENATEISCQNYFKALLDSIFSSFIRGKVKIENRIEDLYLTTRTAVTLGLIINEIATNAIKHGFTDNENAVFSMTMKKDIKNSQYKIKLSNSGKPFPEDIDIESTNTLGLRLINTLVAQLNGTVELRRKPNPMFTIKFPLED
jgi:two-component sensor histidine kinase